METRIEESEKRGRATRRAMRRKAKKLTEQKKREKEL
jgi:hypothetical protein